MVPAAGQRLDELESDVQAAYRRDYIRKAVVHLTKQHLD